MAFLQKIRDLIRGDGDKAMIVTLAGRVRRSIGARLSTLVESLRAAPAVEDSDLWAAAASCRGCSGPKVRCCP